MAPTDPGEANPLHTAAMPFKQWQEADTDSENEEDRGSNSSGAGMHHNPLMSAGTAPNSLQTPEDLMSPEELGRMQDELVALKMHNEQLREEQRRLQGGALPNGIQPNGAQPNSRSSTSSSMITAATKSLSTQMKASTGALARGVAWAKRSTVPGMDAGSLPAAAEDAVGNERESLRVAAEVLRSQVKATMEEVEEFRSVANDAQQVVAVATARERVLKLPDAQGLRDSLTTGWLDDPQQLEILQGLDDEELIRLGEAVLQLARGQEQGQEGTGGKTEPEQSDEDRIRMQQKIQTQQEAIDRLLGTFHQNQSHIIRLQDQLSGKEDTEKKRQAKHVKEKLHSVERQAEGLTRQLETSEQSLRQSQELRTQLRSLAMQAVQRDQVIADMRKMYDTQATEVDLMRDRLLHSLEDMAARARRHLDRWDLPVVVAKLAHREARLPSETRETEAQVELDEDGTLVAMADISRLEAEIEDVQIEKAVLEKRTARQAQDLRALVEPTRLPGRRTPAAGKAPSTTSVQPASTGRRLGSSEPPVPVVASAVTVHDISSDGEGDPDRRTHTKPSEDSSSEEEVPEYSAGMLYVQQVSDLEQRNDTLREELEVLHDNERHLRAEIKEKNDLIAQLMAKTKLPKPSHEQEPFWRTKKWWSDLDEKSSDLARTLEETQEDNVRLRNDIQTMAQEFHRVMSLSKTGPSTK